MGAIEGQFGPFLILSPFAVAPLACCYSLLQALQQSYVISRETASWVQAPGSIVCVNAGITIGSDSLLRCWRALGWDTTYPV
jgi:hypothetical protein